MNILIYNGRYQYNVVRHFVDICINVLKNRNYNVIIIDETIEKDKTINKVVETFSSILVDVVIDFGAVISDIKINNESIYNITNSTYLAIYVDHPSYHMERLSENIKNYLCCFNDKEHVEYVNELLPNHHEIAFFLPHGGLTNNMGQNNQIKTLEEYKNIKSLNIVFAGTFFGNNIKEWENINVDFPKYILGHL